MKRLLTRWGTNARPYIDSARLAASGRCCKQPSIRGQRCTGAEEWTDIESLVGLVLKNDLSEHLAVQHLLKPVFGFLEWENTIDLGPHSSGNEKLAEPEKLVSSAHC